MLGIIADAPVEPILPGIDAREDGSAREQLEGRAHREALVRTMTREASVQCVEERNAETSAALGFDAGELSLERGDRFCHAARADTRGRRGRGERKVTSADHPSLLVGAPGWRLAMAKSGRRSG